MWRAGRQFVVADAARLIREQLGDALDDARAEQVLLEGFDEGGRRAAIHPCEHVAECLATLKGAGVRIGIICDIGLTPAPVVRELLAREDLLRFFDDAAFSDEVGFYKPAPEIFAHALAGLGGIAPCRATCASPSSCTPRPSSRAAGTSARRSMTRAPWAGSPTG